MSANNGKYPPTEVQPRATRRQFAASYKRQIVEEAAQCAYGEVGAPTFEQDFMLYLYAWDR